MQPMTNRPTGQVQKRALQGFSLIRSKLDAHVDSDRTTEPIRHLGFISMWT